MLIKACAAGWLAILINNDAVWNLNVVIGARQKFTLQRLERIILKTQLPFVQLCLPLCNNLQLPKSSSELINLRISSTELIYGLCVLPAKVCNLSTEIHVLGFQITSNLTYSASVRRRTDRSRT